MRKTEAEVRPTDQSRRRDRARLRDDERCAAHVPFPLVAVVLTPQLPWKYAPDFVVNAAGDRDLPESRGVMRAAAFVRFVLFSS